MSRSASLFIYMNFIMSVVAVIIYIVIDHYTEFGCNKAALRATCRRRNSVRSYKAN